jgi:hypothetical protein
MEGGKMRILGKFITSQFRGDHSADICILCKPLEKETVENFVKRIGLINPEDSIELKILKDDNK